MMTGVHPLGVLDVLATRLERGHIVELGFSHPEARLRTYDVVPPNYDPMHMGVEATPPNRMTIAVCLKIIKV